MLDSRKKQEIWENTWGQLKQEKATAKEIDDMVTKGADVNQKIIFGTEKNWLEVCPLSFFASLGAVYSLLKHGADPNIILKGYNKKEGNYTTTLSRNLSIEEEGKAFLLLKSGLEVSFQDVVNNSVSRPILSMCSEKYLKKHPENITNIVSHYLKNYSSKIQEKSEFHRIRDFFEIVNMSYLKALSERGILAYSLEKEERNPGIIYELLEIENLYKPEIISSVLSSVKEHPENVVDVMHTIFITTHFNRSYSAAKECRKDIYKAIDGKLKEAFTSMEKVPQKNIQMILGKKNTSSR